MLGLDSDHLSRHRNYIDGWVEPGQARPCSVPGRQINRRVAIRQCECRPGWRGGNCRPRTCRGGHPAQPTCNGVTRSHAAAHVTQLFPADTTKMRRTAHVGGMLPGTARLGRTSLRQDPVHQKRGRSAAMPGAARTTSNPPSPAPSVRPPTCFAMIAFAELLERLVFTPAATPRSRCCGAISRPSRTPTEASAWPRSPGNWPSPPPSPA